VGRGNFKRRSGGAARGKIGLAPPRMMIPEAGVGGGGELGEEE